MADEWQGADKMPLSRFTELVASEYAAGVEAFEKAHPNYIVGDGVVTARAVLKPMTNARTGEEQVWIDIDEGGKIQRSDIPISILRKPGT